MQYQQLRQDERYEVLGPIDPEPEPDAWIWLVEITSRDRGAWVVLDYRHGTVLRAVPWIA
jgi:hypothetical protein